MFQRRTLLQTLVVFLFLVVLFFIFKSAAKPWEASGHIVLAVHAVPFDTTGTTFGLGIDNVELYRANGSTENITVRTRRMALDPTNTTIEIVLDDDVPVGTYSGIGFTLKSPELRNDWEEDTAPTHVSLLGERVVLMSPFHVEEDKTSALILAFETLQAIHEDAGAKVYLPVIQVETRFDTEPVVVEGQGTTIHGGTIESSATYGMGWDSVMHFNFRANPTRDEVIAPTPENLTEEILQEEALPEATSTPETETTASSTPETEEEEEVEEESDTQTTEEDGEEEVEEEV